MTVEKPITITVTKEGVDYDYNNDYRDHEKADCDYDYSLYGGSRLRLQGSWESLLRLRLQRLWKESITITITWIMRKLITITITVGALNSDYDYAIAEKIGVIAITITDYDCNRTDPCLQSTLILYTYTHSIS